MALICTLSSGSYNVVHSSLVSTCCRFSPEELGILASTLLCWLFIEVLVLWVCLYLFSIATDLKWMDVLAFSGCKYVW